MRIRAWLPLSGALLAAGGTAVIATGAVDAHSARAASAPSVTLSVGRAESPPGPAHRISSVLLGGNGHWYDQNFGGWNPKTQMAYPGFLRAEHRVGLTGQRYPSGTAANLFVWQDAIGPVARRPRQVGYSDGIYTAPTDDDFGLDEWARDTERTGQSGDIMVNATTETPAQAAAEVQYLTGSATGHRTVDGRDWARVRAANGHRAPYPRMTYWEIGNELGLQSQLYWRAGTPVNDRGQVRSGVTPTDLYAFGGSAEQSDQPVGHVHDFRSSASVSTGAPDQHFYAEYPPVARFGTVTVKVAGDATPWTEVASLAGQPSTAQVFTLNHTTGRITFGDGTHGAIPAAHEAITISYISGPHGGFVDFYRQMKRVNPHIKVCVGLSDLTASLQFIRALAAKGDHYDCVVHHAYISPTGEGFPASGSVTTFYEHLIASETGQVGQVRQIQRAIDAHNAGHGKGIGVTVTEYGNNGPPTADPDFGAGEGQAVLMADDLIAWSELGVPEADKSNLNGFAPGAQPANPRLYPVDATKLSKTSLIQRTASGRFTISSTGLLSGLYAPLLGGRPTRVAIAGDPPFPGDAQLGDLNAIASRQADGRLDLLVVNRDPTSAVSADLRTGEGPARLTAIEAPSLTSTSPGAVREVSSTVATHRGVLRHTFPAHSVTRIELGRQG